MMYDGIDTAARITAAQAAKLRENGVSFVCRYIGPESWGKTITRDEVAQMFRNYNRRFEAEDYKATSGLLD